MRDLGKYPLTAEEAVADLRQMAKEILDTGYCGSMRPVILAAAANIIEKIGLEAAGWPNDFSDYHMDAFQSASREEVIEFIRRLSEKPGGYPGSETQGG